MKTALHHQMFICTDWRLNWQAIIAYSSQYMVNYTSPTQLIALIRSPAMAGRATLMESSWRAGAAQTPAQEQFLLPTGAQWELYRALAEVHGIHEGWVPTDLLKARLSHRNQQVHKVGKIFFRKHLMGWGAEVHLELFPEDLEIKLEESILTGCQVQQLSSPGAAFLTGGCKMVNVEEVLYKTTKLPLY